jgi:hypothetical protein
MTRPAIVTLIILSCQFGSCQPPDPIRTYSGIEARRLTIMFADTLRARNWSILTVSGESGHILASSPTKITKHGFGTWQSHVDVECYFSRRDGASAVVDWHVVIRKWVTPPRADAGEQRDCSEDQYYLQTILEGFDEGVRKSGGGIQ